jgi:cytidylate kinase
MTVSPPVVTVDGPAGSGKTTLGRRLATLLGLPLIDTGLFYRAVAAAAFSAGLGPDDPARIVELAGGLAITVNIDPADPTWEARIDGRDLAGLRDPRRAVLLSRISQIPEVRHQLLPLQRQPAEQRGAVAVGRDCGTVVFPQAVVKLFLHAPEAVRAKRRGAQLERGGARVEPDLLHQEIARRDLGDTPALTPAPDAHVIDTGDAGIDEVVGIALERCRAAGLLPVSEAGRTRP